VPYINKAGELSGGSDKIRLMVNKIQELHAKTRRKSGDAKLYVYYIAAICPVPEIGGSSIFEDDILNDNKNDGEYIVFSAPEPISTDSAVLAKIVTINGKVEDVSYQRMLWRNTRWAEASLGRRRVPRQ
jgi:hypothetical protein